MTTVNAFKTTTRIVREVEDTIGVLVSHWQIRYRRETK